MQSVQKPKRLRGGLDTWSGRVLIGLFAVGILLVVADLVLFAGLFLRARGISLPWLRGSNPVVTPAPAIQLSPAEGQPGSVVTVVGRGWKANDPIVVQIETSGCEPQIVATPNAASDGYFVERFAVPGGGCWDGRARILVVGRSLAAETEASAEYRVLIALQTPTPTALPTQAVEPTSTTAPTQTPTATVEPTSTAVPTATSTAVPTATPTAVPTATPTATPTPVVILPTASPTPAIAEWRGEYFDNVSLSGLAKLVRNDKVIDFGWGQGAPESVLPVDGFSVRWSRALTFEEGLYRFRLVADDGIRLYVDGQLVVDDWRDAAERELVADRRMTAGQHTLRVEYYERIGLATARLRWEKLSSYPDWKGEYWPNLTLQGNPSIVRNDRELAFDWGQGSAGGTLPVDGFSARWTRQVAFDAATYRFSVLVDDGVRLWLNDRLILDAWSDHDSTTLTTDYVLARGTYTLKVEYYERIGKARIQVWWEKVTSPSYPDWKGSYWPNRSLSGDVALVRNDREINFDWGSGAPSLGLPVDDFAVRWTRQWYFDAANYRFHAVVDDGVRVWVDGEILIDAWTDGTVREIKATRTMVRGEHKIKVEYYEHQGGAIVHVWWEKVETAFPDWKGKYWPNRELSGEASLVRNERDVDFAWGAGAPAPGLPVDGFSARWSRQVTFQRGLYRFYAWADDGVRVRLDDAVVLNEWHTSLGDQVYSVDLPLDGEHRVVVEYYELAGDARVRFWWQRIGNLITP